MVSYMKTIAGASPVPSVAGPATDPAAQDSGSVHAQPAAGGQYGARP